MKILDITSNLQKVEEQKKHAKRLLADLSGYFDNVLIAGGAPRNWTYNRPANDFDIYIARSNNAMYGDGEKNFIRNVKKVSNIYNLGPNKVVGTQLSNAYGGFILNSLYDFVDEGQSCQLIVIDDCYDECGSLHGLANKIYMTYDFGICKTAMDKDGNFYHNQSFLEDKENKTFTVKVKEFKRNNEAGMRKLVERFEKMERYFPDHKLRISI